MICENIWGKSIAAKGSSKCKGPEAGVCLACSKSSREVHVLEQREQEGEGDDIRDRDTVQFAQGSRAVARTLASPLSEMDPQEDSKQGRNMN